TCAMGRWGSCSGEVGPSSEGCDTLDNDCDGDIDEGCGCVLGTPPRSCDTGHAGICGPGTQTCDSMGRLTPCLSIAVPSPEVCGDGLDSDCDGLVDCDDMDCWGVGACPDPFEGPGCVPGDGQDCLLPQPGVCGAGESLCLASETWDICRQVVLPGTLPEDCSSGEDEDCDGDTDCSDSDCALDPACTGTGGCVAGLSQDCSLPLPGLCGEGDQICLPGGTWSLCSSILAPGDLPEDCGMAGDEDCDGYSDCSDTDCASDPACSGPTCTPGDIDACFTGLLGICGNGQQTCGAGTWGACTAVYTPGLLPEDCSDTLDNDCDGASDCSDSSCSADPACVLPPSGCTPGDTDTCLTGMVGVCAAGQQTCQAGGTWGACVALFSPGVLPEDCSDGLDNDCDGASDCSDGSCVADPACILPPGGCTVGDTKDCNTGLVGICATGRQTCQADETWGVCTNLINTGDYTEDCGDGLDNDCDGQTDASDTDCSAAPCVPFATKVCGYSDVGICELGTATCQADSTWGPCVGAVYPMAEAGRCSDTLDNDCDTWVDVVDPDCGGIPCAPEGDIRSCGYSDLGECALGSQTCTAGAWSACSGAIYPTDEICSDGLDQSCNGLADEFCTVVTCVWNPVCTVGVDCNEQPPTPDAGSPAMQGWVKGLLGTVKSWYPWPGPACVTDGVTGVVTCQFDFQVGSELNLNVRYALSGAENWLAECATWPLCDNPSDPTQVRLTGVLSCTEQDSDPIVLTTVVNGIGSGFNRFYTQSE
ncbi:MAG: MopE-related protein, partial [Patescibacteria group bacterium]|nr:MopE-related protein [Patescibacteria group bacterium]